MTPDLVVYLLMRNDLPSLSAGKGMAQAHHAGVQIMSLAAHHELVKDYVNQGLTEGAVGFSTTLVLGADKHQIQDLLNLADMRNVVHGKVMDPTYPFWVPNQELADLILHSEQVRKVRVNTQGEVLMTRPEVTCAWFLGDRLNPDFKHMFEGLELYT